MKKIFKNCAVTVYRGLLSVLQSDGKFDLTKIGLLIITSALYCLFLNWKFAVLLMVSIGWHESGHVWAMRRVEVYTKGFYFIPFLGGVAISDTAYKSYADKIIVLIMGPLWGMLLALVTLIAFLITGNEYLGAAAWWQAILNLFNLLPVNPLDGGQILRAILGSVKKRVADAFSLLSVIFFAALLIKFQSLIFGLALLLSVSDLIMHLKHNLTEGFRKLSVKETLVAIGSYVLLSLILVSIAASTSAPGKDFNTLFLK
jgi:putative peptide zinc metalloprotease protein